MSPSENVNSPNGLTDPEVRLKAERRRFNAAYKLRVLREADACAAGELGGLLRREGLYSSHLATWREQRTRGELAGLEERQRGRKTDEHAMALAQKDRRIEQLTAQLSQAEAIIDVQKKLSQLLGVMLPSSNARL